MNSKLTSSRTGYSSRAHFSPLASRLRLDAMLPNRMAKLASRNSMASFPASVSGVPLGGWWNPRLVDQLRAPLTRIHE